MTRTIGAVLSICALLAYLPPPVEAQDPPTPAPSASARAACEIPDTVEPAEAFARPIADPRTLAFVAYLERLPKNLRGSVVDRAKKGGPASAAKALDAALVDACDRREIAFEATRLVYVLSRLWSPDDALDLESSIRYAVGALIAKDRLASNDRDALLGVLGSDTSALDAQLQAASEPLAATTTNAEDPCTTGRHAKALATVQPAYPQRARQNETTGTISMKVVLDEHGYVRSVTLQKQETSSDVGASDLVAESAIAAGSTSYAPEYVACKPLAGSYIFRAQFSAR